MVLQEYETFVEEYRHAHPGCHYPAAPEYHGEVVEVVSQPHAVVASGCSN
jgi:uncharacterized short protein YbdD (DUF466 family)